MKKIYSVELDENLVKYFGYMADDVSDRCLTQEEEYLNGYSALLSQVQQSISALDTKSTPEEKPERHTQEYIDNRIEQANADLEALIKEIHNCKDLFEVKEWCELSHHGFMIAPSEDSIEVDYGAGHFLVLDTSDGGIMISNIIEVYDEDGNNIWTGKVELGCIEGVEQEDCDNIYLVSDLPEHVNEGTVPLECDIMDNYHLDEDGEHCYELNSSWWLSVMVNEDWDCLGYVLYDADFKILERSYLFGLSPDTWLSLFKDFLEKYTGHTEAIINTAPNIFHHLKNA